MVMLEVSLNHLTSKNLTDVGEIITKFLMMIYQRSMNRLMYAEVRSAVNLKISP
jgi:hypothetical protein